MAGEGQKRARALTAEAFGELSSVVPLNAGDQRPAPPPVERPARRAAGGTAPTRSHRLAVRPRAEASTPAPGRAVARPRRALPATLTVRHSPLATAVVATAAILGLLDATLPGMVIPSLQASFHATAPAARWTVIVPLVALGMVVPVAGGLGDRLGAARMLRWSLGALAAASGLSALAWNLDLLLALRAVGAAATGLLLPAAIALLCRTRPGRAWTAAIGGGGLLLAPALLPALGAWLAGHLEWRLLPLVVLLLAAAALLGARLWLSPDGPSSAGRPDIAGMVTGGLALGALVLALLEGPAWGWSSLGFLGMLCICGFALALFAVVELSVPEPLVDLGALRPSTAMLPPVLLALGVAALATGFFEVPLLLQGSSSMGGLQAGVGLLLPAAVTVAAMAASVLACRRTGERWLVTGGLLVAAVGTYLLHGVPPADAGRLVALACARGAGLGVALAPLTAAMPAVAHRVRGAAAVAGLCLLLPMAAGLAAVGSALTVPPWSPGSQGASATVQERLVLLHGDVPLPLSGPAFLHTVLLTAALAAIGAMIALRLPGRRSAAAA